LSMQFFASKIVPNPLQVPPQQGSFLHAPMIISLLLKMKETCSIGINVFIKKFDQRFPSQELMDAITIIYP
jgi:hypothetical protein